MNYIDIIAVTTRVSAGVNSAPPQAPATPHKNVKNREKIP